MVKSYCVVEKQQTECVPGSETYKQTKTGIWMFECLCPINVKPPRQTKKTKFISKNEAEKLGFDVSAYGKKTTTKKTTMKNRKTKKRTTKKSGN